MPLDEIRLGQNFDNNEIFQKVVESGSWFAAFVNDPSFLFLNWMYSVSRI